ncbi:DUF1294 domain-containing protein [Clostridium sp. YIM B02505]|uniref:DUF1294 domain-containing protein n=1 Tax=Clostridium yunnanense TaxID=2800325 RepID=A0ABS1EUH5_9CLOT|nr:DUF1294 domain-containing protein [Clostridium yunnanense]MBK1812968.1 DUF1294 domain-containing protein [Clostridium yunnanense]
MIVYYFLFINLIGFFVMYMDKKRAIKGKWRISEKNLFLVAIAGGSLGAIISMNLFRHKTKHWYFKYGLPFLFCVQIILIIIGKNIFGK